MIYSLLFEGTGKSVIGARVAYVLTKVNHIVNISNATHKCVLYCGPSDKSVDNVFSEFFFSIHF